MIKRETFEYNFIIEKSRKILESSSFREIMPNYVEEKEVFLKSLGEDSDIISKVL